jgi:hypothetical protein
MITTDVIVIDQVTTIINTMMRCDVCGNVRSQTETMVASPLPVGTSIQNGITLCPQCKGDGIKGMNDPMWVVDPNIKIGVSAFTGPASVYTIWPNTTVKRLTGPISIRSAD